MNENDVPHPHVLITFLSTSKINLRIIFNDITIGEHELLARIKVFICWLSENENEITHIIL